MNTQSITRKGLKELYDLPGICGRFKNLINDYATADKFSDEIPIQNQDIEEAFKQANSNQKMVLQCYFKAPTESISILKLRDYNKLLETSGLIRSFSITLSEKAGRSMIAYRKLLHIASIYNEGWEPDFKDSTYKYFIYKYYSGGRWRAGVDYCYYSCADRPSGVYFKSRELAQAALENFPEIWDDYFMI